MKTNRRGRPRWDRWAYLVVVVTAAAAGWLLLPAPRGEGPRLDGPGPLTELVHAITRCGVEVLVIGAHPGAEAA